MLVDQDDTPLQLCAIHRTLPRLSLELAEDAAGLIGAEVRRYESRHAALAKLGQAHVLHDGQYWPTLRPPEPDQQVVQNGSATCRERVMRYVEDTEVALTIKKKT